MRKRGISEAVILVKSAQQSDQQNNIVLYSAGVTPEGEWVRLYPIVLKKLKDAQQFRQWSKIEFEWTASPSDSRPETRHVNSDTIKIVGELSQNERYDFLAKSVPESNNLSELIKKGKTLALVRPKNPRFSMRQKTKEELAQEMEAYEDIIRKKNASGSKRYIIIAKPSSYQFTYTYSTQDGEHESSYQEWDVDMKFHNWTKIYGEERAAVRMMQVLGEEYTKKNMVFVLGADALRSGKWLIHSVICMDDMYSLVEQRPLKLVI